jgi:hypothetical protein
MVLTYAVRLGASHVARLVVDNFASRRLVADYFAYAARPSASVSVQKVVPTLTSTSAEIYLSMAGAKQHSDTDFILVLVVGRTSSKVVLKVLYCVAPWCLQRGLQVWRERRTSLQVPEV